MISHCGRFGVPRYFKSDRGTQFVNERIAELVRLLGNQHLVTVAYSKEENAIVERENKEVMRHLTAMLFDNRFKLHWGVRDLPLVQRILNSATHSSIGVSPAQLLFGEAVSLERGILIPSSLVDKHIPTSLSHYADKLLHRQAQLIRIAYDKQLVKDTDHLNSRSIKHVTEFPDNSYVLVSYPNRTPDKITTRWRGPFQVIRREGTKYTVQHLLNYKQTQVHVSRLKIFNHSPKHTDPREVAMKDEGEFEIEHIVRHIGDTNAKMKMQFEVKWVGYDSSENTWEMWKDLRDTQQLHDYLRLKGMGNLIPARYHENYK